MHSIQNLFELLYWVTFKNTWVRGYSKQNYNLPFVLVREFLHVHFCSKTDWEVRFQFYTLTQVYVNPLLNNLREVKKVTVLINHFLKEWTHANTFNYFVLWKYASPLDVLTLGWLPIKAKSAETTISSS